jgi:hypothetical protein
MHTKRCRQFYTEYHSALIAGPSLSEMQHPMSVSPDLQDLDLKNTLTRSPRSDTSSLLLIRSHPSRFQTSDPSCRVPFHSSPACAARFFRVRLSLWC